MKVVLKAPFQNASGSFGNLTFRTINGQTYVFRKPSPRTTPATPVERTNRDKFKTVTQQTTEIMHTTHLRKKYEEAWRKQKKYSTLRGFIFHCLYEV